MKRRPLVTTLVAAVVFIAAALWPNQAGASTHADASAKTMSTQVQHCVAQAQLAGAPPSVVIPVCFPTFAEAIAAATAGSVTLPAEARPSDLSPATFDTTLTQTVIGIDYVDPNYSGNTLTWYVDNDYGCGGGNVYVASSMPAGWNDVVSSASVWGGCYFFHHFEHIDYGGADLVCPCSTMGVMNDATSSEKWY